MEARQVLQGCGVGLVLLVSSSMVRANSPETIASAAPSTVERVIIKSEDTNAHEVEFKCLKPDAYDGPQTQDFHDRVNFLFEVIQNKILPATELEALIKVTKLTEWANQTIDQKASLDLALLCKERALNQLTYFKERVKTAKAIMRVYVSAVTKVIKKTKPDFSRKAFARAENEYTMEKGRPDLVHLYEITAPESLQAHGTTQFVSTQRAFKKEKGPVQTSAIRDRVGLSNAVEAEFQKVNSGGEAETFFLGYRHSSYTPIHIKDKVQRRMWAYENAKEMLAQLVRNYKKTHQGECPKILPLSTMILLTPLKMDHVVPGYESETRQLKENYLTLRMLDGVSLSVEGCMDVVPELTLMNIGANKLDSGFPTQMGMRSSIQSGINAKGFVEFDQKMKRYISAFAGSVKSLPKDLLDQATLRELDLTLSKLAESYHVQELALHALHIEAQDVDRKLRADYAKLKALFSLSKRPEILALYKEIGYDEEKLQAVFKKMELVLQEGYTNNGLHIRDLENKVIDQATAIWRKAQTREASPIAHSEFLEKLDAFRDVLRAYSDAKKLYLTSEYNKWATKFDFQRSYLSANYRAGDHVEFFCKSAEDRTGRLNNKIEEALIYKTLYGELPTVGREDQKKALKEIAQRVYHGGASRDATGKNNVGARGLLIADDADYGCMGSMDYMMGSLAKDIYRDPSLILDGREWFSDKALIKKVAPTFL